MLVLPNLIREEEVYMRGRVGSIGEQRILKRCPPPSYLANQSLTLLTRSLADWEGCVCAEVSFSNKPTDIPLP